MWVAVIVVVGVLAWAALLYATLRCAVADHVLDRDAAIVGLVAGTILPPLGIGIFIAFGDGVIRRVAWRIFP
jgi:hypothetical protein